MKNLVSFFSSNQILFETIFGFLPLASTNSSAPFTLFSVLHPCNDVRRAKINRLEIIKMFFMDKLLSLSLILLLSFLVRLLDHGSGNPFRRLSTPFPNDLIPDHLDFAEEILTSPDRSSLRQ